MLRSDSEQFKIGNQYEQTSSHLHSFASLLFMLLAAGAVKLNRHLLASSDKLFVQHPPRTILHQLGRYMYRSLNLTQSEEAQIQIPP